MAKLFNRAKMTTSTTGSGTVTLSSAANGFQSFADAGVSDGDVIQYVIEEGSAWEIGTGTYSASGTSLTRTPSESSNSGAAITLAGAAQVAITAVASQIGGGTHSRVNNNTGDLFLQSPTVVRITNSTASETAAKFFENGAVELYHDNSRKLYTTSTGVDITGTLTSDGLIIQGNSGTTNSVVFGYGENGGEINLCDETGAAATLFDQAFNSTRLLELTNGSNLILGLAAANTTGNIIFSKAGYTEAMRIDASGNVGIGTTSPDAKLHVVSSFRMTGATAPFEWTVNPGAQDYLKLNAVGYADNLIVANAAGNVGIGTSSPSYPLTTLAGTANTQVAQFTGTDVGRGLRIETASTTRSDDTAILNASDAFGELAFETNSTERMRITSSGDVDIGSTGGGVKLAVAGAVGPQNGSAASPTHTFYSDTNTGMFRAAVDTLGFSTAGSEAMRIDSSGNVGIGTSSPNNYSGYGTLTLNGTNGSEIDFERNGSLIADQFVSSNDLYIRNNASGAIRFQHASSERMRIDSSGNVGIGTSSPASKLDVDGNIRASHSSGDRINLNHDGVNGAITRTHAYRQ